MPKNTETEFVVTTKRGDRLKHTVVRGASIASVDQAKAHFLKLQKKPSAQMPQGPIDSVTERRRSNATRPASLEQASTTGVSIRKEGSDEPDAV